MALKDPLEVLMMPLGCASQGLPTSPHIANYAAIPMDLEIVAMQKRTRFGKNFIYTRYADDLAFSYDLPAVGEMLEREIPNIVAKHGFKLNESKTMLYDGRHGNRMITGIAVDMMGIKPSRQTKRKIRAATHFIDTGRIGKRTMRKIGESIKRNPIHTNTRFIAHCMAEGIAEWGAMKMPRTWRAAQKQARNARQSTVTAAPAAVSLLEKIRAMQNGFTRTLVREQ
jgi:hypothetical protein